MKKVLFIMMLGLMFGQTKLETRVYDIDSPFTTLDNPGDYFIIDLYSITGYNFQYATVAMIGIDNLSMPSSNEIDMCVTYLPTNDIQTGGCQRIGFSTTGAIFLTKQNSNGFLVDNVKINNFDEYELLLSAPNFVEDQIYLTIKLAVTAEFPEEDTGYIEEGYEYCLNEGFNLVSYPCDNSIPIAQAIPNGETFINSIIGEGVASQYLDGAGWVGNLTSLQSGDGYWFQANTSTCFQYECSE